MLSIKLSKQEYYNTDNNQFFHIEECVIKLEHSLRAISKWEANWEKPFLSDKPKTDEEILDYIKCMSMCEIDDFTINRLSVDDLNSIDSYITKSATATTIKEDAGKSREVITSELIYYYMIALNIPIECQDWHINRLLTLIAVCKIKSEPPKKRSKQEMMSSRTALNNARKKAMNTPG